MKSRGGTALSRSFDIVLASWLAPTNGTDTQQQLVQFKTGTDSMDTTQGRANRRTADGLERYKREDKNSRILNTNTTPARKREELQHVFSPARQASPGRPH